jgi:2-polyprenyl-3-methyl-5-hydroxy-6-metoxy-1,4-benzoquinol methylase
VDYYSRPRDDLFRLIPKTPGLKVLEVGCGEGQLGRRLREYNQVVYGIEIEPSAARIAASVLDHVYAENVEEFEFNLSDEFFDTIILGDVLEHLIDPWGLLVKTKRCLAKEGIIISSIPNLQYFPILWDLIRGRFEYRTHGILDKTHLRFFTAKEVRKLFSDAGYKIINNPRIFPYKKKWAQNLAAVLDFLSFGTLRNYLAGQIYVIARK